MKMPEGYETFQLKVINGLYHRSLPESDFDLDYFSAMLHLKNLAKTLDEVLPWVQPPDNVGSNEEVFNKVCELTKEAQETLERFKQWKEWRKEK